MDVSHGFPIFPNRCWGCGCSDPMQRSADFGEMPQGNSLRRNRVYLCSGCLVGAAKLVADAETVVVVDRDEWAGDRAKALEVDQWRGRAEAAEAKLRSLAELAVDL